MDFKCDCGNGKMPMSCMLDDKKTDFENLLNNYSHNFFDRYCYCNQPFTAEKTEDDIFMIKCHTCEDWFHYHHLKPSLNLGNALPLSYLLFCK